MRQLEGGLKPFRFPLPFRWISLLANSSRARRQAGVPPAPGCRSSALLYARVAAAAAQREGRGRGHATEAARGSAARGPATGPEAAHGSTTGGRCTVARSVSMDGAACSYGAQQPSIAEKLATWGRIAGIHGHRRSPSPPSLLPRSQAAPGSRSGCGCESSLHQPAHHEVARDVPPFPSAILIPAHQEQFATSKLSRLVREISPIYSAIAIEWLVAPFVVRAGALLTYAPLARGRPS